MRHSSSGRLVGVMTAVAVSLYVGAAAAQAAPLTESHLPATSSVGVETASSPSVVEGLQSDFVRSGVAPQVAETAGVVHKTYVEGGGRVVTVTTEPAPPVPGTISQQISVSFGTGVYIRFNQTDQKALIAGSIALVTGLICTATAGIGCVVAGSVAAAAAVYLADKGLCSRKRNLEVKISYVGTVQYAKCD